MINYHVGDLFQELKNIHGKTVIIPHVCNNLGRWGAGFVVPLGKYLPDAKTSYMNYQGYQLGECPFVYCEDHNYTNKIVVCNMIAQDGTVSQTNPRPIKYAALSKCLSSVAVLCNYHSTDISGPPEIHTCAFGSALAGGNWGIIATLLEEIIPCDIPINIYSLTQDDQMALTASIARVNNTTPLAFYG